MNARTLFLLVLVVLIAAVIRISSVENFYPAPGDAGHFIQHGVALANGVPEAMSPYWSQGMIYLTAQAVKFNLDPAKVNQGFTILSGILVVLFFFLIVLQLTKRPLWAAIGGIWLATNPMMVLYSNCAYSEMPYMVFLIAGVWVVVSNLQKNTIWKYALAGILFGIGGYFKGLDAAVAACAVALFILVTGPWKQKIIGAACVPVLAFILLLPLCIFTYQRTGSFTPGSKGMANFTLGAEWADSKVVYAVNQDSSDNKTNLFHVMKKIPKRVIVNTLDATRIFNNMLFCKGFRIGTWWFMMLCVGALLWVLSGKSDGLKLTICLLGLQVLLLSLVFVHQRILVPSLPWMVLFFILALQHAANHVISPRVFVMVVCFIGAIFFGVNAAYARNSFTAEFVWWRYQNIKATAIALQRFATEEDVIMSYGPHAAVEFNKTNPLKTTEVLYGSVEDVEAAAHRENVRYIILSDTFRAHWPVAELFHGAPPPKNWILLEELDFPGDESSGRPSERQRIYQRTE